MKRSEWTDALIERLRELAEAGFSQKEAAEKLGLKFSDIANGRQFLTIQFHAKTCDAKRRRRGAAAVAITEPWGAAYQLADAEQRRQIALAQAEMATAPLYVGPSP